MTVRMPRPKVKDFLTKCTLSFIYIPTMTPETHHLVASFVDYLRLKKQRKVSTALQYKGAIVRLLRIAEERSCSLEEAVLLVPLNSQPKAQAAISAWTAYAEEFKKFVKSGGLL